MPGSGQVRRGLVTPRVTACAIAADAARAAANIRLDRCTTAKAFTFWSMNVDMVHQYSSTRDHIWIVVLLLLLVVIMIMQ